MKNPYLADILDIIKWEVTQNEYYRDGIHQHKLIQMVFEKTCGPISTAEKFVMFPKFAADLTKEINSNLLAAFANGRITRFDSVWYSTARLKYRNTTEVRPDA